VTSYKDTRGLGTEQLEAFLRAVDGHLTEPARIVIIGGSAAAFHNATSTTNDIDTYNAISAALEAAVARATTDTGLAITVGKSVVGDYPWNFEDRLERRFADLVHLEVLILERHDLALSKTMRGSDHDQQQIVEMHQAAALDFDTLVERFKKEMTHATGRPENAQANLLDLIELLFGELKRVAAEKALR
jgi:hypothetical protein